jgi:hypothetical protein
MERTREKLCYKYCFVQFISRSVARRRRVAVFSLTCVNKSHKILRYNISLSAKAVQYFKARLTAL